MVDLVDFTDVTKRLREAGLQSGNSFVTEPSLPKPLGPGRIAGKLSYLAVVDENSNFGQCVKEAKTIPHLAVKGELDTVGILHIFTNPDGAETLEKLSCIKSVEREF